MKHLRPLLLGLIAVAAVPAAAQRSYSVIPVLNCIFFDSASAEIPERYHVFSSPEQTLGFTDSNLSDDALEVHRHTLNIIGYRLRMNPHLAIQIQGYNSFLEKVSENAGETLEISHGRAQDVYEYLRGIWEISDAQIHVLPAMNIPDRAKRSYPKDPMYNRENRRVEIFVDDPGGAGFALTAPVVFIPSPYPYPVLTPIRRTILLVRFEFDSPKPGPVNERVLEEFVFGAIVDDLRVEITGRTNFHGSPDRSTNLSSQRASEIDRAIRRNVSRRQYSYLEGRGLEDRYPLYSNEFPEGGWLNSSVEIVIEAANESGRDEW